MTSTIISGLTFIPNFIDENTEQQLLNFFNNQVWSTDLSRRTQHYGFIYDYKIKNVNSLITAPKIPDILKDIFEDLKDFKDLKDFQVIINEYLPGQGIADHIDSSIFGDKIQSLSLGSNIGMIFKNKSTLEIVNIYLPRRSLIILEGDARYNWTHGIKKVKTDKNTIDYNTGIIIPSFKRQTRVSITLRYKL